VASDRDNKLADSGSLYLSVTKTGFKSWRWKYRFAGKEKRLTFGPYPEVSLKETRDKRDQASAELRVNKDPGVEDRKREMRAHASAGATFKAVGQRWYEAQCPRWSPLQREKVIHALKRDI